MLMRLVELPAERPMIAIRGLPARPASGGGASDWDRLGRRRLRAGDMAAGEVAAPATLITVAKTIQRPPSLQPARFVEAMQCLAVAKLP